MRLRNASLSNDDHGSACANDCYLGPERNRQAPTFHLGRKKVYVSISALSNKSICGLKVFFPEKYRTLVVLYGKTTTKTKDEKFAVRQ